MRIAVDARELVGRPTGVGRYLIELLRRWREAPEARAHEWQLYAHRALPSSSPALPHVVLPGTGGTWWEQRTLARALAADRPDVLFAPGYTAPLTTPCPVALTIHDVSFAAHPEWYSWREGFRRRFITTWSARRARVVITDSKFSRAEIVRHLGIPAARTRVILLGAPSPLEPQPHSPSGPKPREPMILFVGSIFRRRHVDRVIATFVDEVAARVRGSRLEIVGENRTHPPQDVASSLQHAAADIRARVSLRSYVDDATLGDLYARASVFAFPSDYEGFGLTPLEALAAGVPPVVLDTPIAREIYGAAARYVPADLKGSALADALVELLTRPEARTMILEQAERTLAQYDWDHTARLTLDAIREAAGA
jgi:glycosyltransferase involved in cell wall biosynthesis